MKTKRWLCILLSIVLLMGLFSVSAFADGEEGGEAPEVIEEAVPETILEETPETILEETPETILEETPETILEETPETILEETPETILEETPENIPENTPENIPENTPENIPEQEQDELPTTYKVTFDFRGRGDNFDYPVEAHNKVGFTPNDPTVPEGSVFDAWYSYNEDGSKTQWDFDNYTVEGDIVLHAEWKEKPTEPSEGEAPQPAPEPAAATITEEPKEPVSETSENKTPVTTIITTPETPSEPVSDEANEPEETLEYPEFMDSRTVNGVLITVSAPEGVFPAGSTLDVRSIPNEQVEDVIEENRPEDVNVVVSYSFDIKVLDASGQPIEPANGEEVSVSFRMAEVTNENLETTVYHISEENQVQTVEELEVFTTGQTAEVSTNGFSIFVVEFIYERTSNETLKYVVSSSEFPITIQLSGILETFSINPNVPEVRRDISPSPFLECQKQGTGNWTITISSEEFTNETLTVFFSNDEWYRINVILEKTDEAYFWIDGIPPVSSAESLRDVYVGGIRWRIIGESESKWLVISKDQLKNEDQSFIEKTFGDAKKYGEDVVYENEFSEAEKSLVIATSKPGDTKYYYVISTNQGILFSGAPLYGSKLFLLSAEEARTYCVVEGDTCPSKWWLRSVNEDTQTDAGVVMGINAVLVTETITPPDYAYVRPAFQLNLTPVLFESAAIDGKSSEKKGNGIFGTFKKTDSDGAVKLTVKDDTYTAMADVPSFSGTGSNDVTPGGTFDVTYSNIGIGTGEYVSAIIYDGDAITYYASLTPDSSGKGTMTLPASLETGKKYTLKVFCEKSIGDTKTDIAGPAKEFTLEVKPPTYTVHFDKNAADAEGSMTDETFTMDIAQELTKNAFTRNGYTFYGWDTEKAPTTEKPKYTDAQEVTNVTTTPDSTVTLYAQWKPIYSVHFDKNAADAEGSMTDETFTMDKAQKLTANAYTRSGYTFDSWNTEIAPTAAKPGTKYTDAQEVTNLTTIPGSTVTLYAQWKPIINTYAVRFDKNATDAAGSMTDETFTMDKAQKLTANAYTRSGYTFDSWNTEIAPTAANPGTKYIDAQEVSNLSTTPGSTVTLYAQWQPITYTYTVRFDRNATDATGSMTDETFTMDKAQKLTANAFTRSGYTFDGWNTEKTPTAANPGTKYTDTQEVTNLTTTPGSTVTLYAQWKPIINTYTVHFDKNAADAAGSMTDETFTMDKAQKLTANAFTRSGYTFDGWNTEKTPTAAKPGTKYTDAQEVTNLTATPGSTVTLYAQWKPITYTYKVHFEKNATSAAGSMTDETFTMDKAQKLTKNAFTRSGYTFDGWNTEKSPTAAKPGTKYTDAQEVTNVTATPDSTVILYAQWKPITYTVKFDKNGETASGAMTDQTFTYDAAQKLTKNSYTRQGYKFNGWNTEKSPTEAKPGRKFTDAQEVKNLTASADAAITLYAQWKPITYTVKFNKNAQDATGTMADEAFTYNAAKKLTKNAFTRTGYTFKGWNTLATPTSSNPGTSFKDLQEVKNLTSKDGETLTLYAQWTKNSSGGGSGGSGGSGTPPRTDDPGNAGLWGILIALSILAITGAAILVRKRSAR